MVGPAFNFTEEGRCALAKFVGITHWLCILPSFICLLTALYIQILIEDKISFIENYDGMVLPGFLVFSGFFGFFAHILCGKVAYTNRIPAKREKWSGFILAAIIATAVIFLSEFISGIMCFVHIANLEDSLDSGIKVAMSAYKNDATTKEKTDILQMTYECCGSRSYKDWFYLTWIHPDYVNVNTTSFKGRGHLELGPNLISDDVPFSCCTPHVLRPCINHHVYDNDLHYNYDYRTKTTLYTIGCTDKLMAFYEDSVLVVAGSLVLSLSFLQIILLLASRLLQTSVLTAMESEDQEGPSVGYLIFNSDPLAGISTIRPSAEDDTLLNTTEEFDDDDATDERYTSLNEDDEHIYNNDDVEEYLATKFANSREKIAHFVEPDYEEAQPAGEEDEPIYQNINQSRNIHGLTRVNSDYGSYMTMNLSNSSSPRKIMTREHFHRRQSRIPASYTPVFRHTSPSPNFTRNKQNGAYIINMATQSSPGVSKQDFGKRNLTRSRNACNIHRATPRRKFSKGRHLKMRPHSSQRSHWSPSVSPRKLQTIRDNYDIMSPRSPGKRQTSTKHRSPKRFISPHRTTFRPGVSYDCNHALD